MNEVWRGQVAILEQDFGSGRKKRFCVDTETGEILMADCVGDAEVVFADGCNALELSPGITLGREVREDGAAEYRVVTDYTQTPHRVLCAGWTTGKPQRQRQNKEPKHTGGKPPFIKLMLDGLDAIEDKVSLRALGMLVKLRRLVAWNTSSINASSIRDVARKIKMNQKTTWRHLQELVDAGVLMEADGGYVLSRDVIQRG